MIPWTTKLSKGSTFWALQEIRLIGDKTSQVLRGIYINNAMKPWTNSQPLPQAYSRPYGCNYVQSSPLNVGSLEVWCLTFYPVPHGIYIWLTWITWNLQPKPYKRILAGRRWLKRKASSKTPLRLLFLRLSDTFPFLQQFLFMVVPAFTHTNPHSPIWKEPPS